MLDGNGKMTKHLKDIDMSYWTHWLNAMKLSMALFVHAWLPDVLTNYASEKLNKNGDYYE